MFLCPRSSWLTALLLKAHGFVLHKQAFRDALHALWLDPKEIAIKMCLWVLIHSGASTLLREGWIPVH